MCLGGSERYRGRGAGARCCADGSWCCRRGHRERLREAARSALVQVRQGQALGRVAAWERMAAQPTAGWRPSGSEVLSGWRAGGLSACGRLGGVGAWCATASGGWVHRRTACSARGRARSRRQRRARAANAGRAAREGPATLGPGPAGRGTRRTGGGRALQAEIEHREGAPIGAGVLTLG